MYSYLLKRNFSNFIIVCSNYLKQKGINKECTCYIKNEKCKLISENIEFTCIITNQIKKEEYCDCKEKCVASISEIENITKE